MLDMTAEVIDFPHGAGRAEATIRATVRALMEGRSLSKEDLAPKVGMSAATLYRKLTERDPTPFKAGEVAVVADALNVSISDLYSGLGGTFVPPDVPDPLGASGGAEAWPDGHEDTQAYLSGHTVTPLFRHASEEAA